jgi:hypothetical protein
MVDGEIRDIVRYLDTTDGLPPAEAHQLVEKIQHITEQTLTHDDVHRLVAVVLCLVDDYYLDRALVCTTKLSRHVTAALFDTPDRNSPANTVLLRYAGYMFDELIKRTPIHYTQEEIGIALGYVATIHTRRVVSFVCRLLDAMTSTQDMITEIEEFITDNNLSADNVCKLVRHVPADVTLRFATLRKILGYVTSSGTNRNKHKFLGALIRICPRIHNFGEAMSVENFEWLFKYYDPNCNRIYQTRVCELLTMAVDEGLFNHQHNRRSQLRSIINNIICSHCCAPSPLLAQYYSFIVFELNEFRETNEFVMRLIGYAHDPVLCPAVLLPTSCSSTTGRRCSIRRRVCASC